MAAKKISLKVPTPIEVGNVDVEFEVRDGSALMGTVTVSRGGLDWRASGKRSAVSVTWKQFGELMVADSPRSRRAAATSANRRAAPTAPSRARTSTGGADASTVRAWAADQGFEVSSRGALPAAVRAAFVEAHS